MELNQSVAKSSSSLDLKKHTVRLEEKNKVIFTIFKILGLFLIKWNDKKSMYTVHQIRFFIYYTFWFLWPLGGLTIALLGRKIFETDDGVNHVNDIMETSLFILGFAVIPAIKTYCINLITRYLPEVLEEIASLNELDVGFKTPLNIHLPSRPQKSLLPKKAAQEAVRARHLNKKLFILPVATVILSIGAFITAWIYGLLHVLNWDDIKEEWPFFTMQFTYLTLPSITTWFSVVFIEWLRMVYEALRVEAEYYYYNILKSLTDIETNSGELHNDPPVTLDEEKIKIIGDYVDKLQEIFSGLNEGFMKFITGINFLVYLISSIFCTVKLLDGFQQIIYMIPLSIGLFHLGLVCFKSSSLIDEYNRILLILKKVVRLERRNPSLLPYGEVHVLRENLLESPPQVELFGGYRVGNGLLIAVHGFIISYAMLANDILELQENNNSCNSTINVW